MKFPEWEAREKALEVAGVIMVGLLVAPLVVVALDALLERLTRPSKISTPQKAPVS